MCLSYVVNEALSGSPSLIKGCELNARQQHLLPCRQMAELIRAKSGIFLTVALDPFTFLISVSTSPIKLIASKLTHFFFAFSSWESSHKQIQAVIFLFSDCYIWRDFEIRDTVAEAPCLHTHSNNFSCNLQCHLLMPHTPLMILNISLMTSEMYIAPSFWSSTAADIWLYLWSYSAVIPLGGDFAVFWRKGKWHKWNCF